MSLVRHGNQASRAIWKASYVSMLRGGSPGEQLFADKALAHVLTNDKEHLVDLVGARGVRV